MYESDDISASFSQHLLHHTTDDLISPRVAIGCCANLRSSLLPLDHARELSVVIVLLVALWTGMGGGWKWL